MVREFIHAVYEFEAREAGRAVTEIAAELSTGTFAALPGETPALRALHGASPVTLEAGEPDSEGYVTARAVLAVPADNVGPSLPAIASTLAGNVFELTGFRSLRLLDFELPAALERALPGPAFGVEGTRRRSGRPGQPLIGTIIKPSVGLSIQETARVAAELAEAGIDFVKDDELIADPPYSPRLARIAAVASALADVEQQQGRRVVYAPNVTGGIDEMRRAAELASRRGAGAAMVCVHSAGVAGVLALRAAVDLPLHGHRAGWGLIGRGPGTAIGSAAHARFWRLAGIDQLHVGGLRSKFFEADESVETGIRVCLEEGLHRPAMPALSAGQWGGQLLATVAAAKGPDFLYLAGGAIHGHPMGPAAGVTALRAAAAAACRGEDVYAAASTVPELAAAIRAFG